jgi:hypothetical protein
MAGNETRSRHGHDNRKKRLSMKLPRKNHVHAWLLLMPAGENRASRDNAGGFRPLKYPQAA